MLSPTTISALPRAIAPTASLVGICEASSKMTRSNFSDFKSIYCATLIGLISIQGQRRGNKVGMLSMMVRMELPRPPLAIFRFRMLISERSEMKKIGTAVLLLSISLSAFSAPDQNVNGKKETVTSPDNKHYAGKYKGQLDCYEKALSLSGETVLAKLIYYPVNGMIIKI